MGESPTDWKLMLRYGHLKTPYHHYTVIAEGVADVLAEGFTCPAGSAFMSMKTWSSSSPDETSGLSRASWAFTFALAASTLVRIRNLSAAHETRGHRNSFQNELLQAILEVDPHARRTSQISSPRTE